jgi:hypothetical protein
VHRLRAAFAAAREGSVKSVIALQQRRACRSTVERRTSAAMWHRLAAVVVVGSVVACGNHGARPAADAAADVATGMVGAWQSGAALPIARANACATAIDDWVIVVGGNRAQGSGFVATDEIDAAQLGADGTLGAWQVAGHAPSAVSQCNATSDGRTLCVVDGIYDRQADGGQVWTATLDDTGHLGALASRGALPSGVVAISTGAAVASGTLLLMHDIVPTGDTDPGDVQTLRTPLGGALAWSVDDWHVPFRAQAQYAFAPHAILALGGYHDPAIGALDDALSAPMLAGPVVGAPVATTRLPAPTAFGTATIVDDWVFVVGGRAAVFGAPGSTDVVAAPLAADGTVGAWQSAAALPVARTNHAAALVGDFLVVVGGAASGPGDTTVLVARVRHPRG